jgi:hypothetical protein
MNSDKVIDFESFTKLAQRVKHDLENKADSVSEHELTTMLEEILDVNINMDE